jgi:hypothetical protein
MKRREFITLIGDAAAARFLDMGGTSPLRVPRIGPAFRFARGAKISARSAERWPVTCGLLRWTAMKQTVGGILR